VAAAAGNAADHSVTKDKQSMREEAVAVDRKMQDWQREFLLLWTGQAVSIFTSSVVQMAIIWYLTERTGSAAILSLATLVGFLPQAVFGPFIGVLIDRHNRKTIMILSDTFIAAVTLILVFVGFYGELPIWLIMAVLFARSIGTTFHEPSLQAVIPLLVPKESLTKCAGYSQTFESVSLLLSPAVAAVLYGIWSINVIILLDVAGALFAVLVLCIIKLPSLNKVENLHTPNIFREAKEGLSVLRKEQG